MLYNMDNKAIIDGLITGGDKVYRQFFFVDCRPLFMFIITNVFHYHVDYDEFVNELYIYLMENDAYRLKQFDGRSSIYQWLKTVALRFALSLRKKRVLIETNSKEELYKSKAISYDEESSKHAKMDIESLLSMMGNERQVYVIRRHIIEGIDEPTLADELGIKVSHLYNIKKRAMTALIKVALTDIQQYGKTNK